MSLYKTMRCRYFDERGKALKPFCSQGNRCRFIHPGDTQWERLIAKRQRSFTDQSDKAKDKDRFKGPCKDKTSMSPTRPLLGPRSSPLVPQSALFKRNQGDNDRDPRPLARDHRGRGSGVRDKNDRHRDRSQDDDLRCNSRERRGERRAGSLVKTSARKHEEVSRFEDGLILSQNIILQQHPRGPLFVAGGGYRQAEERSDDSCTRMKHATTTVNLPHLDPNLSGPHASNETDRKDTASATIADYFPRLASLSSRMIQNSCTFSKEEDKLKVFTELSSQLSETAPSAAKAIAPALLAVTVSHSQCKERVDLDVKELDSLWGELFSVFADGIAKVVETSLQGALEALHQERDLISAQLSAQSISLKRKANDAATDMGMMDETFASKLATKEEELSYAGTDSASVHTGQDLPDSSERKRRRLIAYPNGTTEPKQNALDSSIKEMFEGLTSQMAEQTRALKMLAQENRQLKYEHIGRGNQCPSSSGRSESLEDHIFPNSLNS
ncbi:hypothetical protein BV22DRAFT_34661 [Leucogyrophana mollusca]|uniref:Uncharacterized protein n=1 Tax=Leucogyrophana mollusca TaxID=85980 RepID=A0ACB8C0V1_9AGAM|nr:hypothetical protein BV22DRAFT_34661 [Leucogyrophana mollusca]